MKKILLTIAILFLPLTCFAAYTDQETIVIDHTKVPSTQTNFAVLATSTQAVMKTVGNGGNVQNANGYDIVYSSTPCVVPTLLNWENEKYVSSTGEEDDWILVTSLSSLVDTTIYRCFGNSSISTFQGGASTAVWDTNYKAVYHLPNGSTLSGADSTGSFNGTLVNSPAATAAQIDGGVVFVAANSEAITASSITAMNGTSQDSLSGWFKRTSVGSNVSFGLDGSDGGAHRFNIEPFSDGNIYMGVDGGTYGFFANNDTNWHYIVLNYDGTQVSDTNRVKGYLDGVAMTTTTGGHPGATQSGSPVFLGRNPGASAFYSNGTIDEIRVTVGIIRSANWITTEYRNQSSVATFMTIGNDTPVVSSSIVNPSLFWEF